MRSAPSPCPSWWGTSVASVTIAVGTFPYQIRCAVTNYATAGSCRVRAPRPRDDTTALAQFLPVPLAMVGERKRTLVRALQMLRSRERLAAALQITLEELETYLEGETP